MTTSPLPPKATPAVAFCFFANHVLDGEAWARERLAPFAARTIELRAPLLPTLHVTITPQGRLEPGAGEASAIVQLGPRIKIEGSPDLVAELELLSRTLRWDAEEDLSRVFGDVLAHRLALAGRALGEWQRDAAARLGEAAASYVADESRLAVRRAELETLGAELAGLARALDELERRVGRLA